MKKVTYLLAMIFALALMSTSCEKDDPIIDDPEFSVEDLSGMWIFQSLDFVDAEHSTFVDGKYNTVTELSGLNEFYDFVQLDFNFVNTAELNLYTDYTGTMETDANWNYYDEFNEYLLYSYDNGVLIADYLTFEVMNTETFDGTILKLKLTDGNNNMPIGGVYTLTK